MTSYQERRMTFSENEVITKILRFSFTNENQDFTFKIKNIKL